MEHMDSIEREKQLSSLIEQYKKLTDGQLKTAIDLDDNQERLDALEKSLFNKLQPFQGVAEEHLRYTSGSARGYDQINAKQSSEDKAEQQTLQRIQNLVSARLQAVKKASKEGK